MEETTKNSPIEKETLPTFMEELAEDQKANTQSINDLVNAVNTLTGQIQKLQNPEQKKEIIPIKEVRDFKERLDCGLAELRSALKENTDIKGRKIQVLLFPEQDRRLFYKIVFSRWLVLLTVMLLITNVYKFCVHWSEHKKEVELKRMEYNQKVRAWDHLYQNGNKNTKYIMEQSFKKAMLE